jgi:hypothetical protein
MSGREPSRYTFPRWRPGIVREIVLAAAEQMDDAGVPMPPFDFYEALAEHAETVVLDRIADAIEEPSGAAYIETVRHLLATLGDELFIGTDLASDATLARLVAYLLLDCDDGYNDARCDLHWGMHGDPEWGTRWGIHQDIRDLSPAFVFKVCMKGDVRYLAVECHAPTRRLPEGPAARLRARTLIVSGVPVLAFSPSEVESGPEECVSEINSALATLAQELLALHGIEPPSRHDFRPRTET